MNRSKIPLDEFDLYNNGDDIMNCKKCGAALSEDRNKITTQAFCHCCMRGHGGPLCGDCSRQKDKVISTMPLTHECKEGYIKGRCRTCGKSVSSTTWKNTPITGSGHNNISKS